MATKRRTTAIRSAPPASPATRSRAMLGAGIALALVAGCSSSDDDDSDDDDEPPVAAEVSSVGFVSVEIDEEDGVIETDLNAGFIRFDDTTVSGEFLDALAALADGDDVCFVVEGDDDDGVLDVEFDPGLGATVSAGQTLTFTSPAGTYATLERRSLTDPSSGATVLFYELPGEPLAGLPPAGLILDVPGEAFPAFANVAVPEEPAPLTDFSPPIGGSVGATTAFEWTPSGVAGAGISLGLGSDAESIDCLLQDDGSFTLPDEVTAQLAGTFDGTVLDADRGVTTIERSGDAVLVVAVEDTRVD